MKFRRYHQVGLIIHFFIDTQRRKTNGMPYYIFFILRLGYCPGPILFDFFSPHCPCGFHPGDPIEKLIPSIEVLITVTHLSPSF